jgi:hypothetical protein
VTAMGMLITAMAVVVSLVQLQAGAAARPAAHGQNPQTLYASPNGTIQAFAQDGPLLAWFSPGVKKGCNAVWVRSLDNSGQVRLPDESPSAPNVTCRFGIVPPVNLALAGTNVLWTLREKQSTIPFDYILGAGVGNDTTERRFKEVAHTKRGPGFWLGGIAGNTVRTGGQAVSSLVYGITAVEYVDEIACLSGGSCQMKLAAGGGVYQVVGRPPATLIPNTRAAVEVSVSGSTVAYVPAAAVGPQGTPIAAADQPVEIVDVGTGVSIAHVTTLGIPLAISLTPHVLATLERTPTGLKLAWYSATKTGTAIGSVDVPPATAPEVSANDQIAVFRVGRFLHVLTFATGHSRTVAETVGRPIGVSLAGSRLAWAENVNGRGRIRALYVNGRG